MEKKKIKDKENKRDDKESESNISESDAVENSVGNSEDIDKEAVQHQEEVLGEEQEDNTADLSDLDKVLREKDELNQELEKQKTSMAEFKDKALRAMAETENFKRRKEQELESFKKYASERVVIEILPVLDSLERAVEHDKVGDSNDVESKQSEDAKIDQNAQGVALIYKQFNNALEKVGVKPIESLNQQFDPNYHQAVMQEDAEGVEPNVVIKEMQKGYLLHDKLIRPAVVVVSK